MPPFRVNGWIAAKTHRATENCRGREADEEKHIDPAEDNERERELNVKERTLIERRSKRGDTHNLCAFSENEGSELLLRNSFKKNILSKILCKVAHKKNPQK